MSASSTSVTITGAAMEDAGMEETPLDLGPGKIMTFTEVTAKDLVEQDVAVETNEERHKGEQCHTRRTSPQIHSPHFSRSSSMPLRGMQTNLMLTGRRTLSQSRLKYISCFSKLSSMMESS